jgi:hypothetical protein
MKVAKWRVLLPFLLILFELATSPAYGVLGTVSSAIPGGSTNLCSTTPTLASSSNASMGWGLFGDTYGNLYYANSSNYLVCELRADGKVVRIAGTATSTSGSDGISATSSGFTFPYGVAADTLGNVFITDLNNYSVRKVNSSGIVTTIFNTAHTSATGTNGTLATNNTLKGPQAITVDSQNRPVFVDYASCIIWRIENDGTSTILAGTGTCTGSPSTGVGTSTAIGGVDGLAYDASGNLIFGDGQTRIAKLNTSGSISFIAGTGSVGSSGDGGLATSATMSTPTGIVIDSAGNIFFGDRGNSTIREIVKSTGYMQRVAGSIGVTGNTNGTTDVATVGALHGMGLTTSGDLYFYDNQNVGVRKLSGVTTIPVLPPSLNLSANLIFRTTSTITVTTSNAGGVSFYQAGKAIPGCKNLQISNSSGGTVICTFKPSIHGSVPISASLNSNGTIVSSPTLFAPISIRSGNR